MALVHVPTRLSSIRVSTRGDVLGKVRVVFEINPSGAGFDADFECLSCDDLMQFYTFAEHWECRHCGYTMTPQDASIVIDNASVVLRAFAAKTKAKVKRSWGLVMWLRRLLGRKAA